MMTTFNSRNNNLISTHVATVCKKLYVKKHITCMNFNIYREYNDCTDTHTHTNSNLYEECSKTTVKIIWEREREIETREFSIINIRYKLVNNFGKTVEKKFIVRISKFYRNTRVIGLQKKLNILLSLEKTREIEFKRISSYDCRIASFTEVEACNYWII